MNDDKEFIEGKYLRSIKPGFYRKFFHFNKDVERITYDVTKYQKGKVPFRNRDCGLSPFCLYDKDEIFDLFGEMEQEDGYKMICLFCEKLINMKKFYIDQDLLEKLDENPEKHKKKFELIRIFRDGSHKFGVKNKNSEDTF